MQKKVNNICVGKILILSSLFLIFNYCTATKNSIDPKFRKMSKIEWLQETNSLNIYEEFLVSGINKSIGEPEKCAIDIFGNTDCSHCISEIAKILKILDYYSFTEDNISIYNVNDDFEEISGSYKKYNIYSVPVIFIKKNGILKGKSEGPIFTWENDIIKYCND